jgi:hypothetical protein
MLLRGAQPWRGYAARTPREALVWLFFAASVKDVLRPVFFVACRVLGHLHLLGRAAGEVQLAGSAEGALSPDGVGTEMQHSAVASGCTTWEV